MNKNTVKSIWFINFLLLVGCSATPVHLEPNTNHDTTINYDRGSIKLKKQSLINPELIVFDYSPDELVINLSVTNSKQVPLIVSHKIFTVTVKSDSKSHHGTVYSFDQLVQQAVDKGYDEMYQVGTTAAGIGASFIPFGNIAYSVGRLFYSMGSQHYVSDEERIDKLVFSKLNQGYFRQHTLQPRERYSGFVRIRFEEDLQVDDEVVVSINMGGIEDKFSFKALAAVE